MAREIFIILQIFLTNLDLHKRIDNVLIDAVDFFEEFGTAIVNLLFDFLSQMIHWISESCMELCLYFINLIQ